MAAETAAGVFATRAQAEQAIQLLHEQGFDLDTVSLIAPEGAVAPGGSGGEAVTGATVGGVLGGLGGLLLGAGLLAIPVVGPVLAAGPLVAALGGAALGAGAGGLVGALTSGGMDQAQAAHLAERVQSGAVLVTMAATPRHEEARALLRQAGATETDFSLTGDENASTPPMSPTSTLAPAPEPLVAAPLETQIVGPVPELAGPTGAAEPESDIRVPGTTPGAGQ